MAKKITYEYIKKYIENEGYKLLSTEYINVKKKLKIQCPKGHIFYKNWNKIKEGSRCTFCNRGGKLSYEHVKEQIENEGYKLLSNEYISWYGKLKIQCIKGHIYNSSSYGLWKKGYRCPICSGNQRLSYDSIKEQIENEGYVLLDRSYKNNNTKLKIQCPEGHEFRMRYNSFKNGQRCPICNGGRRLDFKYIKKSIEDRGYKLVSKNYKNNHTKLTMVCPLGHKFKMTWMCFNSGCGCNVCSYINNYSKSEKEVCKIIKSITKEKVVENDRTQIINPISGKSLELDIWLPNLNKAIEFNGSYWHSFKEVKKRDETKKIQCQNKGIELMIIKEKNWIKNKEKEIEKIRNFING